MVIDLYTEQNILIAIFGTVGVPLPVCTHVLLRMART